MFTTFNVLCIIVGIIVGCIGYFLGYRKAMLEMNKIAVRCMTEQLTSTNVISLSNFLRNIENEGEQDD